LRASRIDSVEVVDSQLQEVALYIVILPKIALLLKVPRLWWQRVKKKERKK